MTQSHDNEAAYQMLLTDDGKVYLWFFALDTPPENPAFLVSNVSPIAFLKRGSFVLVLPNLPELLPEVLRAVEEIHVWEIDPDGDEESPTIKCGYVAQAGVIETAGTEGDTPLAWLARQLRDAATTPSTLQ